MLDLATIDKNLLITKKAPNGDNIVVFGRMTWPNFFTPKANRFNESKEDAVKKYSVNLLLPPATDLTYLKKRCQEAASERWGAKLKDTKINTPFKKAEEHKGDGHLPGWTLLRLTAVSKPQVLESVDGSLIRLTEHDEEVDYGGRWAQVTVNPFAYPKAGSPNIGNNGVSLGLNNVLLMHHDEALGGRMKAEDEFQGASISSDATIDSLF